MARAGRVLGVRRGDVNGRAIVVRGDAAHLPLPDASVDLIVTSPPYFGLRSYTDGGEHYDGQIGSEATPRDYLDALWACTAEWVRVLKPSGSLFVNLGDKYSQRVATRPSSHQDGLFPDRPELRKDWKRDRAAGLARMPYENVIDDEGNYVREKSLMGLPWRYALGCIDQGSGHYRAQYLESLYSDVLDGIITEETFWQRMREFDAAPKPRGLGLILRAEIVWDKPNGLPESVTDRVRRSHEQVFHFTRQPRYYSAVDEVREAHNPNTHARGKGGAMARDGESLPTWGLNGTQSLRGVEKRYTAPDPLGKLPGSVWQIPSAPLTVPAHLGVDHFAAYPPALVRRIILGWSPAAVCTACGEGRRPVVDKRLEVRNRNVTPIKHATDPLGERPSDYYANTEFQGRSAVTITGYACACPQPDAPARPGLVLDPFGGTGTTALVASVHGRIGISVDMSADYCRLAQWRVNDPGERARALGVPKPPPVPQGQASLFDDEVSA